jgi:hypothetical protein
MLTRLMAVLGEDIPDEERARPSQIVASYLATAALFGGLVSLFYYPGRIGPAAVVIALIASGMGGSVRRFTGMAFAVAALGWLFGMIIAVVLNRPIF